MTVRWRIEGDGHGAELRVVHLHRLQPFGLLEPVERGLKRLALDLLPCQPFKAILLLVKAGHVALDPFSGALEPGVFRLFLFHLQEREQGLLPVGVGRVQGGVEALGLAGLPGQGWLGDVVLFGEIKGVASPAGHGEIELVRFVKGERGQGGAQGRGDVRVGAPDLRVFEHVLQGGPFRLLPEGLVQGVGQGHAGAAVQDQMVAAGRGVAGGEREGQAQGGPVRAPAEDFAVPEPFAEPHGHGRDLLRIDRLGGR